MVFDALTERGSQLSDWITSSNRLLETTASRDAEISAIWRAFPEFITQSNLALRDLEKYAVNTDPLMRDLRPVGTQLSNLLVNLDKLAPDFNQFFIGLNRLIPASVKGLPAQSKFLDQTARRARAARPLPAQHQPVLPLPGPVPARDRGDARDRHRHHPGDRPDRAGPLPLPAAHQPGQPGGARDVPAAAGVVARQSVLQARAPTTSCAAACRCSTAAPAVRRGFPTIPPSPYLAEEFRNRIIQYVLNGGNTVAPPCREQTPFTEGGQSTSYPHVRPDPQPSP